MLSAEREVLAHVARENVMNGPRRRLLWAIAAGAIALPLNLAASETPQQAYARSWEGKSVRLKQALYTLVFNERGKMGAMKNGRREGLMVATPSGGAYLQFDGRQGRDDVVEKQPQGLFDAVNARYIPDSLEVRSYRKVEPVVIHRYSTDSELFVSRLRVERDQVRIAFVQTPTFNPNDDPATGLTVKWPVPFNSSFSESGLVDDVIRQFVAIKPAP